jgi:hypothetical protein
LASTSSLGANYDTQGNAWPICGEIDVVEHRGNSINVIHGTLHYPGKFVVTETAIQSKCRYTISMYIK